jgi:hypothetical protein
VTSAAIIAAWRYVPKGFTDEQCDALNKELMLRVQETVLAVPRGSHVHGPPRLCE